MKKLFLISQSVNNGYDTYDSAVVVAKSERDALMIHPSSFVTHSRNDKWMGTYTEGPRAGQEYEQDYYSWVPFKDAISGAVEVKCLGVADNSLNEGDVVCASFNAG